MFLGYFTEEAYDRLLTSIPDNADKYAGTDEWIKDFFKNSKEYYGTSKTVEVHKFTPYYTVGAKTDAQKSKEDLENTRRLYDAFKTLTPLQASNKYMWTYLCHTVPEYREYIRNRWMTNARENTIKAHYFVTTTRNLLNHNGLSRLWWYGYLTYDPDSKNHYALTEILLTNQTICTDVMDTLNRMNFNRMKGVLLAIRDFRDKIGNEGITDYFRECAKYLNHYAAVTNLDFLEPEEIKELALNYMDKLRDEKRVKSQKAIKKIL
ncbi:MAG: LAGLIDADG-2 domain-containing protein [Oscillospiraceae bacterium]|jgi:hypothetical protein